MIAHRGFVYFLRPVGQDGPVKIGFSCRPEERLQTYLSWSPVPLELAATLDGEPWLERYFHRRFHSSWLHHEWFSASQKLSAAVEDIAAGRFVIPAPSDVESAGPSICNQSRPSWSAEQRLGASLSRRIRHLEAKGAPVPKWVLTALRDYQSYWRPERRHDPAVAQIVIDFLVGRAA